MKLHTFSPKFNHLSIDFVGKEAELRRDFAIYSHSSEPIMNTKG